MIKKILLYAGSFLAAIVILWSALLLTSLIPNEKIRDNVLSTAYKMNGADPFPQNRSRNTICDNYADIILMNVIWNIDSSDPFVSSLDTKYFDGNDGVIDYGENYGLYAALNGTAPNTDYSRYWHGSAVFIRPLLTVTDMDGVRLTGAVAAVLLPAVSCAILAKRRLYLEAVALPLSFICVQAWNIRLAMEYQPAVLVTLAMLPVFLQSEKKGDTPLIILSVISGTMIAFFDFLTAETLTLLIPLIMIMSVRYSEERFRDAKSETITAAKCSLGWLLAYGGTYLVKWTAASAVTGENKFTAALSSAGERLGGSAQVMSPIAQIFAAPFTNISTMMGGTKRMDIFPAVMGIILIAAAAGMAIYLSRRSKKARGYLFIVFILGAVPYLRYIVLNNHSYLHDFFTYRAQAAVILALLTAIGAAVRKTENQNKKKKSGSHGR
ncbi:MAG: hypothetical protein ACI4JF_07315 [Oscillospiraceae bacterium]